MPKKTKLKIVPVDKVRHLVVVDTDGQPGFYLIPDEAFEKWDGDIDNLFTWINGRRKGKKHFKTFGSLMQHVSDEGLFIHDEAWSTPSY